MCETGKIPRKKIGICQKILQEFRKICKNEVLRIPK